MKDKSKVIFGNEIPEKVYKKAVKSKKKYMKKFGDDSNVNYPVIVRKNPVIGDSLGVQDIRLSLVISVWDLDTIVSLWQWHLLLRHLAIHHTG